MKYVSRQPATRKLEPLVDITIVVTGVHLAELEEQDFHLYLGDNRLYWAHDPRMTGDACIVTAPELLLQISRAVGQTLAQVRAGVCAYRAHYRYDTRQPDTTCSESSVNDDSLAYAYGQAR